MANIYKSKFTGEQIDQMLEDASKAVNIEGNPSGEATVELTKLKIGDTTYSIPEGAVVEGNPSGEATEELAKITIGDKTYSIPEGAVVEGNPSGEATVELTKLKIGNIIYSIAQGGTSGFLFSVGSGISNVVNNLRIHFADGTSVTHTGTTSNYTGVAWVEVISGSVSSAVGNGFWWDKSGNVRYRSAANFEAITWEGIYLIDNGGCSSAPV